MNRYITVIGLWMLFAVGCDPCGDCGEPLVYDPTVKVVFINQDSINKLTLVVSENKTYISELNTWKADLVDTLDALKDTIDALQELIDGGATNYQNALNAFQDEFDSTGIVRDSVVSYTTKTQKINTKLNATITLMTSGKLQLTKALLLNNNTEVVYEDSLKTFALPLLLGTVGDYMESNYEITIVDTTFELNFGYETYENIDEARVARVRARNLTILDSDTVKRKCTNSECISDETTVTVYF